MVIKKTAPDDSMSPFVDSNNQAGSTGTNAQIIRADGGADDVSIEFLANLGSGRAAEVHLVRHIETGEIYAEKLFGTKQNLPEMGRDAIYLACFQAPFPYHTKENAIRAALYRRKVLWDLTEFWFGTPLIADAHYTRWDESAQGYVLGTEYVKGRGPKPGEFNPNAFRNFFINYPVRFLKRLGGKKSPKIGGELWEIDEVVAQMDKLKENFHQAGFIGSEWQVDKMLSVPTSNLLRDEEGNWILIDVESGMPALILLKSLWAAIRLGSFPLFDDTDFDKLGKYLSQNHPQMTARLGEERVQRLSQNVEQLQYHTKAWKSSEPAVFTHKHCLLTDAEMRSDIRKGFAEHWHKSGRISASKAQMIEKSGLRFSIYICFDLSRSIVSGIVTVARAVKGFSLRFARLAAFALRLLYSAFFDDTFLKEIAKSHVNECIDSWQKTERLTDEEADRLRERGQSPAITEYLRGFMVHLGLHLLEPPFVTNFIAAGLFLIFHRPAILLIIFMGPILRTLYTLIRMFKNRRKGISYGTALITGTLPKVGSLGFPLQMSTAHPNLSRFLVRWQLSRVGCHTPLFGDPNSRLEHFFIKTADLGSSMQYEMFYIKDKMRGSIHRKK